MKAKDILNSLFKMSREVDYYNNCDTLKAGDPEKEVKKVAVTMFPTVNVIKEANNWGADLLITHEPLYYNHYDNHSSEKVECAKRKLIEDTGMTIFRYHDHAHYTHPDVITKGELLALDLKGKIEYTDKCDLSRVILDTPMTAVELSKLIEEKLNIKVRIAGSKDKPCKVISCMFGAPGGTLEELKREKTDLLMVGETEEWSLCEYARDADQLGFTKSLILMGHAGSERDGMKYTTDILKDMYKDLDIKYFECDIPYIYI